MTGIKRIYKKRAMVKRPENTERPTKGLVNGRKRVIEVSHGSYFKKIKNLNEPGQRGSICPNPCE
jgi:hypothetical protein